MCLLGIYVNLCRYVFSMLLTHNEPDGVLFFLAWDPLCVQEHVISELRR